MAKVLIFEGAEIPVVAALIFSRLADLEGDDRDIADLALDKALAAMPGNVAPDILALIESRRDNLK